MTAQTDELTRWLRQQHAACQQLDALLAGERQALLERDAERLLSISRDKGDALRALSAAAAELPDRLGVEPQAEQIEYWLDNTASTTQRNAWIEFRDSLERCRAANESNGAVLTARFNQIEASLRYLREAAGHVSYGAKGVHDSAAGGRSIARA